MILNFAIIVIKLEAFWAKIFVKLIKETFFFSKTYFAAEIFFVCNQ